MQPAQFSMKSLANNLAVTHNDRSNQRIWTHPPAPALRKLKSPLQVLAIRSCQRGSH
jgi:hypothetical protein